MGVLSSTEASLPVSSRFLQRQRLDRLFLFDSLLNVLSIPFTWPLVFLYQKTPDSKRPSHQMHTVEFADIRIRAALPLHPYLYKHPHLFLRLVADESVCGDTAGVDGDVASGLWEFNGRLYAPRVKQSLNLAVLTGVKGPGIPVVSVTLKVGELLAQEKAFPNRHQYIVIFDSRGARQLKLVMTCSIKLSPILGRVSQAVGDKDHTIDSRSRNNESNFDLERMHLLSREDLESSYVMANLMPDHDSNKARRLSLLGYGFHILYEKEHRKADLEKAISIHEEAMQRTGLFHPHLAVHTHFFAMALSGRFQQSGDRNDIERTISYSQTALRFTEDLNAEKPLQLSTLGSALLLRSQRFGGLVDVDDSISNLRQALQLAPDGHPVRAMWFNNLGLSLQFRFERLGGLADLEDSISNFQHAVHLTPDGRSDKPGPLSNLGLALESRFGRLGGLADLEDAISNLRRAAQLTPDGHPEKSSRFDGLGLVLRSRYLRLGGLADLDDAISNQRRAVLLMPDGHPENPILFSNLGVALQSRFLRLGGRADLEDAISNLRQAVQLTPDGYPDKPIRLYSLACTLESRSRCFGITNDLESALSALSTAANYKLGSAMMRFKAARTWAEFTEKHSRSPLDAFQCAIDLLPRIAWLGLAVTDQHALLADVGGIVRDAVAAAIRYGEYETAVVWAEQGRSIVWQNLLGLRSPIDDLRENHPELAHRLHSIAQQLEGPGSHPKRMASAGDAPRTNLNLAVEWDNLIDKVRRIPNFEGFLRAKGFRQLAAAAHEGPVVILNVNDSRCDALILNSNKAAGGRVSVLNIPLERFSYEKSKNMFQTLTELLSSAGVRERNDRKTGRAQSQADGETKFKTILRILWQDVVQPVIEGLAFPTESKRPPRIWWCTTGLLAFLPIHAAGLYDTQTIGDKVSDYAVSSYTPTLNAILELSDSMEQEDFQVLTVAQASAPGASPIPKTEDEVRIIHRLTDGARQVNLMGDNATVDRVRKEMTQSNWIHLACHGKQNSDNPMESGFLLHDRMLKLSEIVKMSLPKADFAFLSACQTAMGDEKVAEESVHLAAGMLISGCRGVIATTWSIRDEDGPKIAEDVYRRIFNDGKPNRKEAVYALHEAVKRLRDSGAKCTSWVPFIHIGR